MRTLLQLRPKAQRPKSPGFSLIELIVVTAILTVVVSGIVAVFLGSMKAVRQGYRHMDAYEMTRGAFQVVERDLTNGFTSRDNGDYYQFYGTPYGMTFVATASNFQGIGNNGGDNFCRVTYVVRQIDGTDPTAPDQDPLDIIDTKDGKKPGYVLIRFVERGVDNLDDFPVDWTGNSYPASDPETAQGSANLRDEYNAVANATNFTKSERDALLATKKRELWLRMLRGEGVVYNADGTYQALTNSVPDFFKYGWLFAAKYRLTTVDALGVTHITNKLDVHDFVVATNVCFNAVEVTEALNYQATKPEQPIFGIKAFSYGLPRSYGIQASRPSTVAAPTSLDQPFGQHYVTFTNFWSSTSTENLPNFPLGTTPSYGGEGSPLAPRIPVAVHFHLRFRFPAPSVAAAEIERVLDETVDVPSAYWRAQLGLS